MSTPAGNVRKLLVQPASHSWCCAQAILGGLDTRLAAVAREAPEAVAFLESRFALLHLLSLVLYYSPRMQRRAVRTWDTVAAVFGLLRDPTTRNVALRMVSPATIADSH